MVDEPAARQMLRAADRAAEVALGEGPAFLGSPLDARDSAAAVRRDLLGRVVRPRVVARDHPASPKAHFVAGSFMGMAGKWLRRRDLESVLGTGPKSSAIITAPGEKCGPVFGAPDEYLAWWTARYGERDAHARQQPWLFGATKRQWG